jgi:hypothetical protein
VIGSRRDAGNVDEKTAMNWYRLDLRNGFEPEIDFAWRAAWKVAHEADKPDRGHALFRASGSGDTVILYFPPIEQMLAETFGARVCDRPAPADLWLVCGHARAWQHYFPGSPQQLAEQQEAALAYELLESNRPARGFAHGHASAYEPTHPLNPFRPTEPSHPGA